MLYICACVYMRNTYVLLGRRRGERARDSFLNRDVVGALLCCSLCACERRQDAAGTDLISSAGTEAAFVAGAGRVADGFGRPEVPAHT